MLGLFNGSDGTSRTNRSLLIVCHPECSVSSTAFVRRRRSGVQGPSSNCGYALHGTSDLATVAALSALEVRGARAHSIVTTADAHTAESTTGGRTNGAAVERMMTVDEAADRLGTSPRFIRRLVAERRIAFIKLGRHVRLSSTDIDAFIRAGRVEP